MKIRRIILDWINYHKVRRRLKKGKALMFATKIDDSFISSEDGMQYALDEIKKYVKEQSDKYKLKLDYTLDVGYIDDDYIKNLKTFKINMTYGKANV